MSRTRSAFHWYGVALAVLGPLLLAAPLPAKAQKAKEDVAAGDPAKIPQLANDFASMLATIAQLSYDPQALTNDKLPQGLRVQGNTKDFNIFNSTSPFDPDGFKAIAVTTKDGLTIIAFAGTSFTSLSDWAADLQIAAETIISGSYPLDKAIQVSKEIADRSKAAGPRA